MQSERRGGNVEVFRAEGSWDVGLLPGVHREGPASRCWNSCIQGHLKKQQARGGLE